MQHLKDCVERRARRPLEAEAKHGIYDHVEAVLQGRALRDVLGGQEEYAAGLQLRDEAMVQRLVCPLGVCHLHGTPRVLLPGMDPRSHLSLVASCLLMSGSQ